MRAYLFGLLVVAVLYVGLGFPVQNAEDDAEDLDDGSLRSGLTGERLLNHILEEVDKGHVTRERISHWLSQIQQGVRDGSLTQNQVDSFMETMKTKLRTNSDSGTCCPFGSLRSGLTGERLLNHILEEVDKGHVTRERISHWLSQIQQGVRDGSLTQNQVDSFIETMKTKLRTNSDSGTCCPFG